MSPETKMARAVISRAFQDSLGYLNPQSSCGRGELSQLRTSAHKFINASKEGFRQICDIAEADPDYVMPTRNIECSLIRQIQHRGLLRALKNLQPGECCVGAIQNLTQEEYPA